MGQGNWESKILSIIGSALVCVFEDHVWVALYSSWDDTTGDPI